jgi:transglutaminase-like putative cysteine protease
MKASVERLFQFSLLGLVTSGYLAVAASGLLDLPTTVLTGLALLLRGLMAAGWVDFQIPEKGALYATLAYVLFYPADYFLLSRDFIGATIHLVFFLSVLRILTAKTQRDYLYVQLLALLEILGACVLTAQLNFLVFLVAFVLFGLVTLASGEIRRAAIEPVVVAVAGSRGLAARLLGFTAFISAIIFVVGAGLFFLLPRTARAAFQHLTPTRYHLPGFSNEVTLGQIGEIKLSSEPLLYIKMLGDYKPKDLKWRGSALQSFDGRRWYNARFKNDETIKVDSRLVSLVRRRPVNTKRFHYDVRVKELGSDVIFFAGKPEFLSIDTPQIIRSSTGGYRAPMRPPGGFRYVGYSYVDTIVYDRSLAETLSAEDRAEYLRLSGPVDPRMPRLAAELAFGARSLEEEARAIEYQLQRRYSYTLRMPDREPADPVAHFLFERKKGHCEYFASAMAVLLRLRGIPSRVVTGFQGSDEDPINGWTVIRASDAHSWVEAFLPDHGWMVFDPTPADPNAGSPGLLARINRVWDVMEVFWSDWVMSYDLERQLVLASQLQRTSRGTGVKWLDGLASGATWFQEEFLVLAKKRGPPVAVLLIVLGMAGFFGPELWRKARGNWRVRRIRAATAGATEATVLYRRMLEILHERGIEKPAWLTPVEFARLVPRGAAGDAVSDFTAAYLALRYGGRREAVPQLFDLIRRLEELPDVSRRRIPLVGRWRSRG